MVGRSEDQPGVVSESGILPFLTGKVGEMSLEEIKRRRAIGAALASRKRDYPKTLGEGLTYASEAIADRVQDDRLSAAEKAYSAREGAELVKDPNAPAVAPAPAAGSAAVAPDAAVATADASPVPAPNYRDSIAALITPGGGGGPPANPTMAGAIEPPLTGASSTLGGQLPSGPVAAPAAPLQQLAALSPAGTMSDAPPPGAGGLAPPVGSDENPITPTDIPVSPLRLAQAGRPSPLPPAAGGVLPVADDGRPTGDVPHPLDRPVPLPGAPPGTGAAPPVVSRGKPVEPPYPDPAPITVEEKRASEIRLMFPGSERAEARAKALEDYGKGVRAGKNARAAEEYKVKYDLFKAQKLAEEEFERNRPANEAKLKKEAEDRIRAEGDAVAFPLGKERHLTRIEENFKKVEPIMAGHAAITNARRELPNMFTGTFADKKLAWEKFKAAIGGNPDPRITPTEAFKPMLSAVISALRPAIAGTGAQANYELQQLEKAAAGDIKLEAASINKIFDTIERLNFAAARQHQKVFLANTGRDENMRRVASPHQLPMEDLVPKHVVTMLQNDAKAAYDDPRKMAKIIQEFDDDMHTPGLAMKLLGRR